MDSDGLPCDSCKCLVLRWSDASLADGGIESRDLATGTGIELLEL